MYSFCEQYIYQKNITIDMHEYELRDQSELKALNVMWRDAFLNKTENELH